MADSQKIGMKKLNKYAKLTFFIFLLLLGIIPQTPHIPASDNTVRDPLLDPLQWEPFTGVSAQPASFELSGLTVNPAVVEANSPTTITVNVENTGGISGVYNVELKLNGVPEASKRIILDSGAKTSVSFNVTRSCPRFYTIYVGPLTGTLEVVNTE